MIKPIYSPSVDRYENGMKYRRCGKSGILLPEISLGLWHNFGDNADYNNMCKMCYTAFDNGITHFDLANNYGRPVADAGALLGEVAERAFCHHEPWGSLPGDSEK